MDRTQQLLAGDTAVAAYNGDKHPGSIPGGGREMKLNLTSRIVRIISPVALTIAAITASRADTALLTPTADAFVVAAQPTNNYGGAGALSAAAAGLARGEFQSVLRFDTS